MGKKERYIEESQAALRELMTEPAPSPEARAGILARRRIVRASLEDRRDRMEIEALSALGE